MGLESTDDSLEARFSRAIDQLLPQEAQQQPLAIAVSGGSDSMALVLLAQQLLNAPITALTVDHQLRDGSGEEAAKVAAWMQQANIPHHSLHWQHEGVEGNLQAEARKARYALLTDWCKQHDHSFLLVGHTEDDQAETIAFRQEREAGPVGLAGMSALRDVTGITLLRPLLTHTRQELQQWLSTKNVAWIDDPSNENEKFARIRIRNILAKEPVKRAELLALGRQMSIQRQQIEKTHAAFIAEFIQSELPATLMIDLRAFLALEESQACFTLGQILGHVGGDDYPPRYAKLQRAVASLRTGNQPRFTLGHCLLDVAYQKLRVHPETDSLPFGVKPLVPTPFRPIFAS